MRPSRKQTLAALLCSAALITTGFGAMERTLAATSHQAVAHNSPTTYHVTADLGTEDFAANIYTPNVHNVYVGDSVVWTDKSALEPHTISFGPNNTKRASASCRS